MDTKAHWEDVWAKRDPGRVSWYQPRPETSLRLIREAGLGGGARILDVGGGASTLVDQLLADGYRRPGVLDVSAQALSVARERLGDRASEVEWIEADVTDFDGGGAWDIWHDRAVLHFLLDAAARQGYRRSLLDSLKPGGAAIIATFAPDGPTRCSGLDVRRHSAEDIQALLGPDLELEETREEDHTTPSGAVQRFLYARLRRAG